MPGGIARFGGGGASAAGPRGLAAEAGAAGGRTGRARSRRRSARVRAPTWPQPAAARGKSGVLRADGSRDDGGAVELVAERIGRGRRGNRTREDAQRRRGVQAAAADPHQHRRPARRAG